MKKFFSSVFPGILVCVCLVLLFASSFMGQTIESEATSNFNAASSALENKPDGNLDRPRVVARREAYLVTANGALIKSNSAAANKAENKNESFRNPSKSVVALERQVFEFLNKKRIENDLAPLVWSDSLAQVARMHSENMARFKFFSHRGQDGLMVDARADRSGVGAWQGIGENIAFNQGFNRPADFACERWMMSVKHRDNILSGRWRETGIGVGVAADGAFYFTQVFIER